MIIKCSECGQKNRVPAARVALAATCGKCEHPLTVVGVPHAVKPADFDDLIANSPLPVVVDFWAPWCAPCRMIGPILDDLATRYDGQVKVVKVNVDEEPELANAFQVRGIPTIVGVKDGRVAGQQVGFRGAQALGQLFDDLTGTVRVSF